MNNINTTKLAERITNGKWLLDGQSYASLVKQVNAYGPSNSGMLDKLGQALHKILAGSEPNEFVSADEYDQAQGTAVIYVNGILVKGASPEEEAEFGLCNIDRIAEQLDAAAQDQTATDICLCFSSPGGEITGIPELARKIDQIARNIKPIFAWTDTQANSAAYWLMSQVNYIGATESSDVGNVGVYTIVESHVKALEAAGIEFIPFASGKYKLMGHEFHELSDEEKKILSDSVIESHTKFKNTIKAKRAIADEHLEGLSFGGETAVKLGFIDETVDDFETFMASTYNKNNMKYTKFANAVKEAFATKPVMSAEKPEEHTPETKAEKPEEKVETKEEKVEAKAEEKVETKAEAYTHEYACPYCTKKFSVSYDPTKPQGEDAQPEEKAESKFEDEGTGKEKNELEEPAVEKEKKEPEDKQKPGKQALSNEGWAEMAFGIKPGKQANAFHEAVNNQFYNVKLN